MRLSVDVASPLLVLPRTSASAERADVDLGALRYRSGPTLVPGGGMLESSTVELQGMCISAVAASGAAPLLQRVDGVKLVMRRPLRGPPLTAVPAVDMEVAVPAVNVAMSTTEYAFICAVLGENFREAPALPPPVGGVCDDDSAAGTGAAAVAPQADAVVQDAAAAAAQVAEVAAAAAAAAASGGADAPEQLRFRLALQLHDVSCMLYDGAGRNRPLAEARIVGGWVGISTSVGGVTCVAAAVRDLTIADARVTTPFDRRAVLGVDTTSGFAAPTVPHAASSGMLAPMSESGAPQVVLLVVDYCSSAQDGTRIGVRLQRPSLAVDVGFLLAVGRFFVPSLAGGTAEALDAVLPNDLVLRPGGDAAATVAKNDTLLTPRRRMLADAPADGAEHSFVFDGGGHALVLPPAPERRVGGPSGAVVLVGPGRTLTLRNARLVRAERLEEAVQLAPGARLIMDPSLKMVYGGEEDEALATPSPPRRPSSPEPASRPGAAATGTAAAAPPKVAYAMSLDLDIVGLQLRFVEVLKQGEAEASAAGDAAAAATAAAAAAKPRGEQAGWLRTRVGAAVQYRSDATGAMMGAQLHGLLIEAHLPGAAASLPLLAPTDAAATYTSAPGGDARVGITTSAIDLRLSPRLLSLVNRLAAGAAAVFSHAPTRVSTSFQLLWTAPPPPPPRGTSAAGFLRADAADAVSRLCMWRPVAPPGYAPLGDALTSGTAPPTVAALVMRDSGALCLPPLGYAKRMALPGGVTLWEPLPPPGCVAAGCVAAEGDAPPPVSAVRCPRAALVVEALPLECMHCDDAGAVWRVGNAAGTAVFALGCVRHAGLLFCIQSIRHSNAIPSRCCTPARARHAQLRACCGTCASRWVWMRRTPQRLQCRRRPLRSKCAPRRARRCGAGPSRRAPHAPSSSSARCALRCNAQFRSATPNIRIWTSRRSGAATTCTKKSTTSRFGARWRRPASTPSATAPWLASARRSAHSWCATTATARWLHPPATCRCSATLVAARASRIARRAPWRCGARCRHRGTS
jgi:vacuolar protein sorting-associated protein 13A/C